MDDEVKFEKSGVEAERAIEHTLQVIGYIGVSICDFGRL